MSRFAVIPPVPYSGVPSWEIQILTAMIQNVNLLTANQERNNLSTQAVLQSTYNTQDILPEAVTINTQQLPNNPVNTYVTISGYGDAVPYDSNTSTYSSLVNQCVLASDMEKIILELTDLRTAINNIIIQLVS